MRVEWNPTNRPPLISRVGRSGGWRLAATCSLMGLAPRVAIGQMSDAALLNRLHATRCEHRLVVLHTVPSDMDRSFACRVATAALDFVGGGGARHLGFAPTDTARITKVAVTLRDIEWFSDSVSYEYLVTFLVPWWSTSLEINVNRKTGGLHAWLSEPLLGDPAAEHRDVAWTSATVDVNERMNNARVPGAVVRIFAGRDTIRATSDAAGHIALSRVPSGRLRLQVREIGMMPVTTTAHFAVNCPPQIRVRLAPSSCDIAEPCHQPSSRVEVAPCGGPDHQQPER